MSHIFKELVHVIGNALLQMTNGHRRKPVPFFSRDSSGHISTLITREGTVIKGVLPVASHNSEIEK